MSNDDVTIDQLARALDQTRQVIARVRPDQAGLPTPCPGWDLRSLMEHLLRDLGPLTARTLGDGAEAPEPDELGDDWGANYRRAAAGLLAAWRREGAAEGTVELPFGEVPRTWFLGQHLSEVVVHGWDLAVATGQPTELDPDLGRSALLPLTHPSTRGWPRSPAAIPGGRRAEYPDRRTGRPTPARSRVTAKPP